MQMADEVPDGSGQLADEVPEGSGADDRHASGGFRCRWLMRFRGVWGQKADVVPESSGADCR